MHQPVCLLSFQRERVFYSMPRPMDIFFYLLFLVNYHRHSIGVKTRGHCTCVVENRNEMFMFYVPNDNVVIILSSAVL